MFFERLLLCCEKKQIKKGALASVFGTTRSTINGWESASPNSSFVIKAAEYFNVSTDYLLGLTDDPSPASDIQLDEKERVLIDNLRAAPPGTRETVLKMASAALAPDPVPVSAPTPVAFSSPKDGIIHHEQCERRIRKRVLGRAAAGLPLETAEEWDTYVSVPDKFKGDRFFVVQAAGDSMIGADINNGDYCLFDSQAYRNEGAIMYVQVEGMADGRAGTIKRVYVRPGADPDGADAQVELRSANPAYSPMLYPTSAVEVEGVLKLVISPDD